ncbi:hypothetical protein FRB96_003504 [Tulasnella sp. 330]|nr:hypothetical protein FRB96_003504 [Tulasnella sp. 330]
MTAPERVEWPVHKSQKEWGKEGLIKACYRKDTRHSAGLAKHPVESERSTVAAVDRLGASLLDILHRLRTLEEELDCGAQAAHLDSIWTRWTMLSSARNESRWRAADTTILRHFIRLAGKLHSPSLLSSISSLLSSSSDILPHHEHVLHPGRTQHNITGKRVALQWALAQTMLGAKDWSTIVRSLQDAGLAPSDTDAISKEGMGALMSRVIKDWLPRDHNIAFDLFVSASRHWDHPYLLGSIRIDLARTMTNHKHFDRAAFLLANCIESKVSNARMSCVSYLVKALFDDAVVSVTEDVGRGIGRAIVDSLHCASSSSIALEEARQWEWCILLLTRSYCFADAVDVTQRLSSSLSWRDDFLQALAGLLCKGMRFADAQRTLRCIPCDHPSYIPLHRLLFEHAAKADATRYAKFCWDVLSMTPRFRPSNYERLLWRHASRNKRLGKRTSPLPVTRNMQTSDHRSLQLGHSLLTTENRFKLGKDLIKRRMDEGVSHMKEGRSTVSSQAGRNAQSHNTDVFNAILSSRISKRSASAKIHRVRVQEVFDTFAELTGNNNSTRSPPRFSPDLVTLNIMIKAWMQLDDVTSEMIQSLFDRVISLGFPSSIDRRTFLSENVGSVFRTPLSKQSSQHSWLLQQLMTNTSQSPTAISVRRHVLPLYRMFMKELYRRGDLESARTVVHIYKSVRIEEDLRDDVRLREKQLRRLA